MNTPRAELIRRTTVCRAGWALARLLAVASLTSVAGEEARGGGGVRGRHALRNLAPLFSVGFREYHEILLSRTHEDVPIDARRFVRDWSNAGTLLRLTTSTKQVDVDGLCISSGQYAAAGGVGSVEGDENWRFGDGQVVMLSKLFPGLRLLELFGSSVTDRGLASVARLERLEYLGMPCLTTDGALRHVTRLGRLKALNLRGTRVRGEGFSFLRELPLLAALDVSLCGLTPASIGDLQKLEHLKVLRMSSCPVTDRELGALPPVLALDLSGTEVSVDGMRRLLADSPSLRLLKIEGVEMTEQEKRDLREGNPSVVLQFGALPWPTAAVSLGGALDSAPGRYGIEPYADTRQAALND